MRVRVRHWPLRAHLHALGQHERDEWGLISWRQVIRVRGVSRDYDYAAWVPRAVLSPDGPAEPVPRLRLGDDPRTWPPPDDNGTGYYLGRWTYDGTVPAPARGVEVVREATWRDDWLSRRAPWR